jgi:hypothetical protein
MVCVPGGTCQMGSDESSVLANADEFPDGLSAKEEVL